MTARRAIVTAAGSGIGRAIAEAFAQEGYHVFICDIDPAALASTVQAHENIDGLLANVGNPQEVEAFFKAALTTLGGLDVLVNNAGIGGPHAAIEDIAYADWDATISINLSGMFYCLKQVIPVMKAQKSGAIINLSTGSTRTGLPGRLAYVASKEGVNGITYTAARELGKYNIRCNAILPGAVEGPRVDKFFADIAADKNLPLETVKADILRYISMRTQISPQEIADMALFMASDKAKHVSGQFIGVCGNMEWEE